MTRTLGIADELVQAAQAASGERDETIAVETVLREALLGKPPRKSMFDLIGRISVRDDYDYKALRAGDGESR